MMNALAFPGSIPDPAQAAEIRLRVLSLGAGVQSTTLALMAAHGEIGPMPDCAIFADTGWEPNAVYEHLAWLDRRMSCHSPSISSRPGISAPICSPAHAASGGPRSPPSHARSRPLGLNYPSMMKTRTANPSLSVPASWQVSGSALA